MRQYDADLGPQDDINPNPDSRKQGNGQWLEDVMSLALRDWGYRTWTRVNNTIEEIDIIGEKATAEHGPDTVVVECKDFENSGAKIGRSVVDRLVSVSTEGFRDLPQPILCHTTDLANWETVRAVDQFDVTVLHVDDLPRFDVLPAGYPPGEHRVNFLREFVDASRLEFDPNLIEYYRLKGTNTTLDYRIDDKNPVS